MSYENRPLHVLVLDDDDKILRLLKLFMRQLGYRVTTAQNGREGIRKLLRHHFDLIIVDVQMPEVNGFEFAEEVLRLWPWEKIIFCTGLMNKGVEEQAYDLGVSTILEKPLSFNTLEEAIQKAFHRDSTEQGTPVVRSGNELSGCELSHLREYTHHVMDHHLFGSAIADFSSTLMKMVPSLATGVLGIQGEYGRLSICTETPLDPGFLKDITNKMCSHLEFFSGEPLPCVPQPEIRTTHKHRTPLTEEGHQVLMTPVAGGRDAVGILFVVLPSQTQSPPSQTTPLRVCAHHLATVIECLEHASPDRMYDPLTGALTWSYLELKLKEEWSRAKESNSIIGWLDVDLSNFKSINEAFGFDIGDGILKKSTVAIDRLLEAGEFLARRGADEFCILCTHTQPDRIQSLARDIVDAIRELNPLESRGADPVECCVGMVATVGDHGITSHSQFIECAEHARFVAECSEDTQISSWTDLKASGEASITLHPVLVVDDDPQISVLIKRILNRNMYEVTGVESVAEAISLMEKGNRYEVLLTDLSLPHQDGVEMMRLAKEIDPRMIPVVISGNISKASESKLHEAGANDIVKKPFQPEELREVVKNAVELFTRQNRKNRSE